jgi:uncharacterized protein GlcG (DUF336 family)
MLAPGASGDCSGPASGSQRFVRKLTRMRQNRSRQVAAPAPTRGCHAVNNRMSPRVVTTIVALGFSSWSVIAPALADDLVTTHRLSAELASAAVSEVVASCARQGYNETAVLVDADGVRQAVLRGDRAGSHTLDSANDKAYTAASFKSDTSALVERSKTVPGFSALFTQLPHLILFGGGIVIKLDDDVIGALGASGAPGAALDDACARAGLDKIRDRLKQ